MESEEESRISRMQRITKIQREKKRKELLYKVGAVVSSTLAVLVGIGIGVGSAMFSHRNETGRMEDGSAAKGNYAALSEREISTAIEEGEISGEESFNGEKVFQEAQTEEKKTAVNLAGEGDLDARPKRKSNRRRKEEFDILKASRSIPISGTAVAGEVPVEKEASTQGEVISDVQEEVSGLSNGLDSSRTPIWAAHETVNTMEFGQEVISQYGILIDIWDGSILSERRSRERMNPASMTKVLTLLVAAEHLTWEDMDQTEKITREITDYCVSNRCSIAGYDLEEEATVMDLFYGTVLPSGADAALALANYVAGSHEAFVDMMNEKVEEMGLAGTTHFTNCVGLYDENHYTTAYDMAVILKVAADNEFCREVLSRQAYTTTPTQQHPEGLLLVNWFLRRIEDRDTHGIVLCAKTGFVNEAGNCAASLSVGDDGREYICVTGASTGVWDCIADQEALYRTFLPEVPSGSE